MDQRLVQVEYQELVEPCLPELELDLLLRLNSRELLDLLDDIDRLNNLH